MGKSLLTVLLIFAVIAGIAGAALSVAMVISAVRFSEWGRVILYCVTTAVCVEMVVLAVEKMRSKESS